MGDRTSVSSLLCFGLFVMACTALVEAEHKGAQELNCTFTAGTTVSISIVNNCGSSAKVRTCSAKFQQCVGYPTSPNHFQDCHQRIANGTTVDLVLDTERGYIVIDCPNWWGPSIDNWWTVEPKNGDWPAAFTIPAPKK